MESYQAIELYISIANIYALHGLRNVFRPNCGYTLPSMVRLSADEVNMLIKQLDLRIEKLGGKKCK